MLLTSRHSSPIGSTSRRNTTESFTTPESNQEEEKKDQVNSIVNSPVKHISGSLEERSPPREQSEKVSSLPD